MCCHPLTIPSFVPPQAFGQAYTNQRKVAEDGETNEETLLQESACKEAYYMGRLLEMQTEVTLSRSVASNAQAETDRLNALVQELREVSRSMLMVSAVANFKLDREYNIYILGKSSFL